MPGISVEQPRYTKVSPFTVRIPNLAHSENGNSSPDPHILAKHERPMKAKQEELYLVAKLKTAKLKTRVNDHSVDVGLA